MLATLPTEKVNALRLRRLRRRLVLIAMATGLAVVLGLVFTHAPEKPQVVCKPVARALKQSEATALLGGTKPEPKKYWHPPHKLKLWMAVHNGRVFRVIQLPRCEHLETVVAYAPCGETLKEAKLRFGGIAACTGSFHNPRSMALADFLQNNGQIVACARTGRSFVAIEGSGKLDISSAYSRVKGNKAVTAVALGQRLVPLRYDGFSTRFMNERTDRMAIGLNSSFIFIVQGKSDIWRLSRFIQTRLPVTSAINCDGGHVVRGKGPVHLVFRWKPAKRPGTAADCRPALRR